MNAWESIILQSRVYDGYYEEERLPQLKWDWPKGTWFQGRLDQIREQHYAPRLRTKRNSKPGDEMRTI